MFKVGDKIIYGNTGVCEVVSIGPLDIGGVKNEKEYYTLRPFFKGNGTIFTPVDNDKIVMRHILSKDETMEIINEIDEIKPLEVHNEKLIENEYKEEMKKCDCRDLVRVIKTIYKRQQKRSAEGKKTTATDERYFRIAEDSLYGEFGVVLNMSKDEVRDFITDRVEKKAATA